MKPPSLASSEREKNMQLLILLMSVTFANSINDKIKVNAQAVANVRTQVQGVGNAQQDLKSALEACGPKHIDGQKTLLSCAQQFTALSLRFRNLANDQLAARRAVNCLPDDFAPSKIALNKVLDSCEYILNETAAKPKELSKKYFDLNATYVAQQFEIAQINATAKARTTRYCKDLQFKINSISQTADLILMQSTAFEDLYKMSQRMKDMAAIASVVSDICQQKYDLSSLNIAIGKLEPFVSEASFRKYQSQVCTKASIKHLNKAKCANLSLNPYAVEQLLLASGNK